MTLVLAIKSCKQRLSLLNIHIKKPIPNIGKEIKKPKILNINCKKVGFKRVFLSTIISLKIIFPGDL